MGVPASLVLSWLGLAGSYLAMVGALSTTEAVAGALCGALGALWVRRILRCGDETLRVGSEALRPIMTAFLRLPAATARIGARLLRRACGGAVAGTIRPATPEEAAGCPVGGDDPRSAGRRAVSVLATSLAPDAYVLRLDHERGRILVHAIEPARSTR